MQNFVSAAVGMAVAAAFARGLARSHGEGRVGNFFSDLVRGVVRVLLPMALVAAVVLVLLGVDPELRGRTQAMTTLTGGTQQLTGGPVASQEAIKELGTNGGGFYNVNSAHPFENPTPLSNIFEIFLMLVIPFAMAWAFGLIVRRPPAGRRRSLVGDGAAARGRGRADDLGRDGRAGHRARARRRRDGGQGGPVRHGGVRALRRRDDRHVDRRRQLHARLASPPPAAASRCST